MCPTRSVRRRWAITCRTCPPAASASRRPPARHRYRGAEMTRQTFGKKNPNLPFYPAVRAGDFIFVSGQVPKDAEGNMFCGTIEEETRGCIEAVRRALKEAGA